MTIWWPAKNVSHLHYWDFQLVPCLSHIYSFIFNSLLCVLFLFSYIEHRVKFIIMPIHSLKSPGLTIISDTDETHPSVRVRVWENIIRNQCVRNWHLKLLYQWFQTTWFYYIMCFNLIVNKFIFRLQCWHKWDNRQRYYYKDTSG